ncbi:asparagine--tRNA ligase [Anaerococcus sp. AGMB00486]|uniref:Asparagine--tRNA ligase n=2 Tax=Anaerococcus TaxID=165779 RepID=A0ABX2NB79_9FIRM|nr:MULTISPECIES: asparagine--tRNA ligase [Anaerococcus]MDY3005521.1 asparagine--tRNA ligase [Anaerococcus porci]MSS78219.1 asparagine--tRNA ligase [Anaerococcus porci]NVF11977.1 asparagine--tRNA ligase [Anaerococcus faecalis]
MKLREIQRDLEKFIDKEITLEGWIRQARFTKNVGFIELNDGTIFKNLQVVLSKDLDNFEELKKEHLSASLRVSGLLVKTNNAKQAFELQANKVIVLGHSDEKFPIQKQKQSLEYMRTIPHLRARTNTYRAVFRLRSKLAFALHNFFQERGFIYLNAPIITASDTEGAGEMFQVTTQNLEKPNLNDEGKVDYSKDFFGKKSYLTVSGQLEAEDFALAFSDIYTFGPTFRAEESNTPRHAAEFWMLEPEIAFADYNDCMDVAENMIRYMIDYVLKNCKDEITFFNEKIDDTLIERLEKVKDAKFARITYTDAIKKLKEANVDFEYPVEWGMDLQTEHERYLSEKIVDGPVFVTDYPKDIKAFYMRRNEDGKTVAAFDLLVPAVGELIGGSQREERYDELVKSMEDNGLNIDEYQNYLDLRRYGSVVHSGYGLGFERAVMYLTGMKNIRDVIQYPRTVKSFASKN